MKHLSGSYRSSRGDGMLLAAAIAFCLVSLFLGMTVGSVTLDFTQLHIGVNRQIFFYVRLPRTLASFVTGAALAVAGAVIQGVLANRLASPGIIGVNSGAGLAVTLCASWGILGGWRMALCSFVGAFAAVMIVAWGAKKWSASRGTVILAGVAINSLLNAVSTAIVTLDPEIGIMSNDFKVGDFSAITYSKLIPASVMIAVALTLLLTLSNELDIMGMGHDMAHGLGLDPVRMRFLFLFLAALLAGAAVSMAGLLSFVGLIVPNALRRICGGRSRTLLPLSVFLGGGFVTLCDLLARTLFAPHEIPVGIIMACIGAPFFIVLLIKGRGGYGHD